MLCPASFEWRELGAGQELAVGRVKPRGVVDDRLVAGHHHGAEHSLEQRRASRGLLLRHVVGPNEELPWSRVLQPTRAAVQRDTVCTVEPHTSCGQRFGNSVGGTMTVGGWGGSLGSGGFWTGTPLSLSI